MMKLTLQGKNLDFSPVLSDTVEEMSSSSLSKSFLSEIEGIEFENEVNITNDSLYYSLSEFNEIKNKKRSISVFHLNTASLGLHFDELHTILTNCNTKFDFIDISETGFKSNSNLQNIEGYTHYDCYTESSKGGVRLYISKKFDFKTRMDLQIYESNNLEYFLLKYSQKKINLT